MWPLIKGCFVRNFVPCICIAFLPSASPLLQTIINGLGGACKFAILGKYTFNAFSRGFIDVFLWGVLCRTLPTWSNGTFTGYTTLFVYIAAAVVIEVRAPSTCAPTTAAAHRPTHAARITRMSFAANMLHTQCTHTHTQTCVT